jgi:oligoendopeptidase F
MSEAQLETVIPQDLDASTFERVEPLYNELLGRDVLSAEALEQWLYDRSELASACSETRANLYITMTCETSDKEAAQAYADFIQNVAPKIKPLEFELDKKQKALCDRFGLDPSRYAVLQRDTAADVELFREENIPLETELDNLSQEYDTVIGAMMVEFDGQERTLPQMGKFLEVGDRDVRERAWRATADRRLQDAEKIDEIFDKMIRLRDQVARNAGFENYIGFAFKAMHRFDYTPEGCAAYHRACEEIVAPFMRRRAAERREALGVESVRPWDVTVDPLGRAPLAPFEGGVELVSKSRVLFEKLDARLGEMFASLGDGSEARGSRDGARYDLDSRKGKAPGGYQYPRDRSREPFIFMNAAGLHRDVETMVHEAGHAFHSMLCNDEPLLHYRHSPIEFAEVASMSMELLTMPYWSDPTSFYPDEEDADRARRRQLEGTVSMLAWIAAIDAFQHWLYANPAHSRQERTVHWRSIAERFGTHGHFADWSGLEPYLDTYWQRQSHLFGAPFYYIEYGIAQLGALQIWLRSLEEGEKPAVDDYIKALSLGGTRPLPELFDAAGVRFDFGRDTVARLVERAEAELAKLPA